MRIAVVGATGRIGRLTRRSLEEGGHDVVPISRGHDVDVRTGRGLDAAMAGVEAVVDVLSSGATEEDEAVSFFTTTTGNLLEAERRAGVRHHVLLSIAGVTRVRGNAHYAGKRAQERLVAGGGVPHTIVAATQFHDFAEMVASWTEADGAATIAPLLVQPVAPQDVAEVLARTVVEPPRGRGIELAGPEPHDLVDMARRTYAARGRSIRLVPSWQTGIFDAGMAGDVLLPSADALIGPTSFDDWLAALPA